jgi:hypothetical protein
MFRNGADQKRFVCQRFLALHHLLQWTTGGATKNHAVQVATLEQVGAEMIMDICIGPTKGISGCRVAVEEVKMPVDDYDGIGRISK